MAEMGEEPYLNHLRRLRDAGFRKVYLVARGGGSSEKPETMSIDMTEWVASTAERQGIISTNNPQRYTATDSSGRNRHHILIEAAILPPPQDGVGQNSGPNPQPNDGPKPQLKQAPPNPIKRTKGR
jgi:hypothetical protein